MKSQFFNISKYINGSVPSSVKLNRAYYDASNTASVANSLEQVYQFYRSGYQLDYNNYIPRHCNIKGTFSDYWGNGQSFTITDYEWNGEEKNNLKKEDFL